MLDSLEARQKKALMYVAAAIVLLILAAVVLPRMQQPAEDTAGKLAKELTPPNVSEEEKVRIVQEKIVVPGPINVSDKVQSYSEQQVIKLLKDRVLDSNAHIYSKGSMRAATGAEFGEFLVALKNNRAEIGFAKAMEATQTAFWGNSQESRHTIGAGFMITRDDQGNDHSYALVLVMTGSKPAIAAVSATSTDPENNWFIWTRENTPGKEAYIATLTSG
ncbi:MAG: hypothetical protein NTX14_04325 [Candidatus Nealsonbacteria bacterium]|nr:hypothetical protein [Candidatus Nealsonbacteria bacterium]